MIIRDRNLVVDKDEGRKVVKKCLLGVRNERGNSWGVMCYATFSIPKIKYKENAHE